MNKETEPFFTAEDKEHLDIAYGRTLAQADEIHTLQQQVEHLMGRFCPRESYDIDMEIKKLYDKSDQLWKMLDEMKQPKPREATISKTETVEKGRIATAREYLLSKGCLDVPDSRFMHNMTELCTLMDKFANSLREQWQREAFEAGRSQYLENGTGDYVYEWTEFEDWNSAAAGGKEGEDES